MSQKFSNYTYGVGLELEANSFKQIKNELKVNLDNLSKMVKSYGKVLKIDPNADLSKLFTEVRKIQSIVDGINSSDNAFAGFVDKGVLGRISTLEEGLKSVSSMSDEIKSSMAGLRESISSALDPLKASGQAKFPATFDSLFGNTKDQSGQIQQVKNQLTQLKEFYKQFDIIKKDLDGVFNVNFSKNSGLSDTQFEQFYDTVDTFQNLTSKLKSASPNEMSGLMQQYKSVVGQMINLFGGMSDAQFNDTFIDKYLDQIDGLISGVKTKHGQLKQELQSLQENQTQYQAKLSSASRGKSLGIQTDYTAQVKVTPKANEAEWLEKINGVIGNVEGKLKRVTLTPTFSRSKNIEQEVEGNLAQINHAVKVDLKVTDNIEQFNQKIKNIDQSIKNAKAQLEKEGNFKIKFEYEEGGKFKDAAYKIINQFKNIESKIYIANGKKFIQDIKGLREKAKSELKNIPADIDVTNQDSIFSGVDALRAEIDEKIGNIGINLHIKNIPQFMAQAAMMKDSVEQCYNDNPIGAAAGSNVVETNTENATKSDVELSEKAKQAQANIEKIKGTLKSLTELGIKSPDFLKLGAFDKNLKPIKGSKGQISQLLQDYEELCQKVYASKDELRNTYGANEVGYAAYQEDLNTLQKMESILNSVLQRQIQYTQSRLKSTEEILTKEKQITEEKKEQSTVETKKTTKHQSTKQPVMDVDAALKKQQELNAKLQQSQAILDDLNKNGINSSRFAQIGEWDKESSSFKKNSQHIQELLNKYKELKDARVNSGGGAASKEELSLRNQLGKTLSNQKKHIADIIANNKAELTSVEAVLEKEKQVADIKKSQNKTKTTASSEQQNTQQLAMSAEEATKRIRSLNGTLTQQKRVLKDLETNKFNASSFIKLGEWDKDTGSFKKNSQHIQELVNRYNELRQARINSGGKTAVGEEASIRGKLAAILREQKRHVTEIITKNQEELQSVKQISAAYKQASNNKTKAVKSDASITESTKRIDELTAKLNKAKETRSLLKSGGLDAIGSTKIGDVNKRLESVGSSQNFKDLLNVYNKLIAKRNELEKAGKTGSAEYIQLAKIYQGVEQQMNVIYQDQLKYTQSRIRQLETEIAKEKEILNVKSQQTVEADKQKTKKTQGHSTNKNVTSTNTASATVKLDGKTLNSLAKDATLQSIDGKINNILTQLGNGVVINGSNISIEASNVSVSGKGASSNIGSKGTSKDLGEKEVKLTTISSYSQQLVALEERIKRTGLYTDDLQQKFVSLHSQLNAIEIQDDADTYKFDLDRFKEDFEQLKTYDKLYQDFIKSQSKQIQLNDQIATSNGPTAQLQEQLKIEEATSIAIEEQLLKYTTLYNQRARQLAIDEAIKNANQEIAKSSAAQSDKDINKQNNELIKIVDRAQTKFNDMQYTMQNSKVPMADAAIAKFKQYEHLLTILKTKQQEVMDNPALWKDSSYKESFNSLLQQMQNAQTEFEILQKSSENFLSKIKSIDDIKPLGSTFDATNLMQLHNEMRNFANQAGIGTAKLIEFNDVERTATFEIRDGKGQVQQLTVAYDEATNSLGRYTSKTKESLSETQKFFNSIKHSFQNVARYIASFGSVYRLFAMIKQGVQYVREIDSALTELKKVTDGTDASYHQFLQDMSKTGSIVGSTVAELTSSAADWARLGYSMQEAGELAKNTNILMNVSEFDDVNKATDTLISSLQAFKDEGADVGDFSMQIIDQFNEVGKCDCPNRMATYD